MEQATTSSRSTRLDLPTVTENDEISVTVGSETFSGPVTRIDTYSDSSNVERVVQFNMAFKHRIDESDWKPWKAYLIEEPTGSYRVNVVLYNGQASRSRNLDAPDNIEVQ